MSTSLLRKLIRESVNEVLKEAIGSKGWEARYPALANAAKEACGLEGASPWDSANDLRNELHRLKAQDPDDQTSEQWFGDDQIEDIVSLAIEASDSGEETEDGAGSNPDPQLVDKFYAALNTFVDNLTSHNHAEKEGLGLPHA